MLFVKKEVKNLINHFLELSINDDKITGQLPIENMTTLKVDGDPLNLPLKMEYDLSYMFHLECKKKLYQTHLELGRFMYEFYANKIWWKE